MKIHAELDLDEIMSGPDWDTSLGEMVRDELKTVIKKEVHKAITESPELKKAINLMQRAAALKIIETMTKKCEEARDGE